MYNKSWLFPINQFLYVNTSIVWIDKKRNRDIYLQVNKCHLIFITYYDTNGFAMLDALFDIYRWCYYVLSLF